MRLSALDWHADQTFELTSEARLRRNAGPIVVGLGFALVVLFVMLEVLIYRAYRDVSGAGKVAQAQQQLVVLGGLVIAVGLTLALALRRHVLSDFEAAQRALTE